MSKIITLSIVAFLLITVGIVVTQTISFSNKEYVLRNTFEQKSQERVAFYDKMWKIISQKSQIALKNDSSFRAIVDLQVTGQKNGENVMWAWVQQSNPTATFSEVTSLYKELGRAVEAQREGFFIEEKYMQDVVLQHSNLIQTFPGSFYNLFLGRTKIVYKPVSSSQTDAVFKTGKDDNVKLF